MMDKSKVPLIRFKGFSGEWEEKRLGDVVDLNSGRDYKHLFIGNIPVYGTGGYMLSVNRALSYSKDAVGIGRKGTIDKPYVLKAPFWTVDTLFYALPKKESYLPFIYTIFQKINWKQKDESTGVPSLSKVAINNIQIFTSKIDEQTKIGNYFQNLDKLIEQKEKKYQKLKQFKKAMLEKMFPKDGEDTPEIRFKGFRGEWKESQLGDIATITIGEFVIKTRQNPNSPYPVYNGGKSNTGFYNEFNNEGNKVIISARGANAGYVNFEERRYWAGNSCYSVTMVDKSSFCINYFYYFIKKNENQFKDNQQAANIPSVSKNDTMKFKVNYPKFQEQTRISNYLQKLDKLIDLHQKEIKKLKNIKKASLEKMFV